MEIVGFIALLLIGLFVFVQGTGLMYVVYGFSGRFSWPGLIVAIVGGVIVYFTIMHAPFTISLK